MEKEHLGLRVVPGGEGLHYLHWLLKAAVFFNVMAVLHREYSFKIVGCGTDQGTGRLAEELP